MRGAQNEGSHSGLDWVPPFWIRPTDGRGRALDERVLSQLLQNNRLVYEGLLRELEENHQLTAPDWTQRLEAKLWLKFLVSFLPHTVQHMLHYRMLGLSWEEIGKRMGLSAKQAKSRFYRGIQKVHEKLVGVSTKHGVRQEPE